MRVGVLAERFLINRRNYTPSRALPWGFFDLLTINPGANKKIHLSVLKTIRPFDNTHPLGFFFFIYNPPTKLQHFFDFPRGMALISGKTDKPLGNLQM